MFIKERRMKRVTMIVLPVVALTCFSSSVEALWAGSANPKGMKTSKSTGAGVQPNAHDTGV